MATKTFSLSQFIRSEADRITEYRKYQVAFTARLREQVIASVREVVVQLGLMDAFDENAEFISGTALQTLDSIQMREEAADFAKFVLVVSKGKVTPDFRRIWIEPSLLAAVPKSTAAPIPIKTTAPARTISNGTMAEKLGAAVEKIGLQGGTAIAQFRNLMKQGGAGREYSEACRTAILPLLNGKLLEATDWPVLTAALKKNLFFNSGLAAEGFLRDCPPDLLRDLLLANDGLHVLVGKIRNETYVSNYSIYAISFILDVCVAVGADAKDLLRDCGYATNRMKQRGYVSEDHWLVVKFAAISAKKSAPVSASVPSAPIPDPDHIDRIADAAHEAAEAAATEEPVLDLTSMSIGKPGATATEHGANGVHVPVIETHPTVESSPIVEAAVAS